MFLLARAQSLSGRPGDALVMLGRIVDLGTTPDVIDATTTSGSSACSRTGRRSRRASDRQAGAVLRRHPQHLQPPQHLQHQQPLAPVSTFSTLSTLSTSSFSASTPPSIDPRGLAHDAVSRRFVVGDRKARRLVVIDEVSRHVVNYVSAASAGFYEDLTAFTIDARRGDLWVVSVQRRGGRVGLGPAQAAARVGARAVRGADGAGRPRRCASSTSRSRPTAPSTRSTAVDARIFRVRPGARALEPVMRLEARHPTALTAADDRTLYVAAEKGLVRVDLAARAAAPVKSVEELTALRVAVVAQRRADRRRARRRQLAHRPHPARRGRRRARSRATFSPRPPTPPSARSPATSYYYVASAGVIRRMTLTIGLQALGFGL